MLTQYFYIAGCIPFLILGLLHTAYSIADIYQPKRIVPNAPGLMGLMKESTLALTKETDMWRAWVGFNISHGIGILFFASAYLYLSICHISFLMDSGFFIYAAPLVSLTYVILAKKYWFSIPLAGSVLGLLCFSAGLVAQLLA